jgi:hypothetical protein
MKRKLEQNNKEEQEADGQQQPSKVIKVSHDDTINDASSKSPIADEHKKTVDPTITSINTIIKASSSSSSFSTSSSQPPSAVDQKQIGSETSTDDKKQDEKYKVVDVTSKHHFIYHEKGKHNFVRIYVDKKIKCCCSM